MIQLTEEEIKLAETIIEKLPYRGIIDNITALQGATENGNKIVNFFIEQHFIESEFSGTHLTDKGRKFQELKTYDAYLRWYKESENSKVIIKWITKKWWIPLAVSFAFTIGWDLYKKKFMDEKGETRPATNNTEMVTPQRPNQHTDSSSKKSVCLPLRGRN